MLFPEGQQEPTVFVNKKILIKERDPRPLDITKEETEKNFKELMDYMDKNNL